MATVVLRFVAVAARKRNAFPLPNRLIPCRDIQGEMP